MLSRSTHLVYLMAVLAMAAFVVTSHKTSSEQIAPSLSATPAEASAGHGLKLTPEFVDRCLEVAREINPALADQLTQKRTRKPQEFEHVMRFHSRNLMAMVQLKDRDPELYEIKLGEFAQDAQVRQVASDLRKAIKSGNVGEAEALKSQLRTLLVQQLALSLKSRGEHICRIEEQVLKLREELKREGDNFYATVQGRMQHYMQEPSTHPSEANAELLPALETSAQN